MDPQTCKELHKSLESRYVWQHVLRDILSVIPLPNLRHALPQLSVDELKQKAIIAARLAHKWNQATIVPHNARKFECDCDVSCFQLLPGGKWMVVAQCDGNLELHDMTSEPPEVVFVDSTLCDEDWHIDSFYVDFVYSYPKVE